MKEKSDQELPESEIERRRDAALLRALSTPHKKQADMKTGKRQKRDAPDSAEDPDTISPTSASSLAPIGRQALRDQGTALISLVSGIEAQL